MTPWTAACQAHSANGIFQAEYWSGLPLPFPGNLPYPGIEPGSLALQADSLSSEPPRKPLFQSTFLVNLYQQVWTGLGNDTDRPAAPSSTLGLWQLLYLLFGEGWEREDEETKASGSTFSSENELIETGHQWFLGCHWFLISFFGGSVELFNLLSITFPSPLHMGSPYVSRHRHMPVGKMQMGWKFLSFSFFWPCHTACRILAPWPGMEPMPPAVMECRVLTTRLPEVPEVLSWTG